MAVASEESLPRIPYSFPVLTRPFGFCCRPAEAWKCGEFRDQKSSLRLASPTGADARGHVAWQVREGVQRRIAESRRP